MLGPCSFCGELREVVHGISGNICKSCAETVFNEFADKNDCSPDIELKPHIIKAELDKYVIGQNDAKKVLSVAVYNHYKRINSNKKGRVQIDKSNILMIGPTGSGKTYIMKILSNLLDVPMVSVDSTSFTEAGYVGDDVVTILKKLYIEAGMDMERAEKGIVYVDEIDKIMSKSTGHGDRDVNGMGVQQSFLKLMEGGSQTFSMDKMGVNEITMKTDNILFVFGGAFINLVDKETDRMHKKNQIGFANISETPKVEPRKKVTAEDIIKYGFIPEFIGRIPVIVQLSQLTREELGDILTKPKNALIKQYKELMKADGVKLDFDKEVIDYIVDSAVKKNLGARGLRSCIEDSVMTIMYELPKYPEVKEFLVTKDVLQDPEQYINNRYAKQKPKKQQIKKSVAN